MSKVTIKKLKKRFGAVTAVHEFDMTIEQGEFISLLGPSGCGKTTTLRMIAGFETPSSGAIFFEDKNVTHLKPNLRNTGMVFQNFALFPHLTVAENIAFGLKARGVGGQELKRRVENALKMVELSLYASRSVTQLSGGQQQRVALARAIVIEPEILLLDEPLSNLDAKLREETREEIKTLQRRLAITTVYVTHDQDEALSLSDRIVVMNKGECVQIGSPAEIYQKPVNEFVAKFVGGANVLQGTRIKDGQASFIQLSENFCLSVNPSEHASNSLMKIGIRPEHISISPATAGENIFPAIMQQVSFNGSLVDYKINAGGVLLHVKALTDKNSFSFQTNQIINIKIDPENIYTFPQ